MRKKRKMEKEMRNRAKGIFIAGLLFSLAIAVFAVGDSFPDLEDGLNNWVKNG